jgi:hypothetical protein
MIFTENKEYFQRPNNSKTEKWGFAGDISRAIVKLNSCSSLTKIGWMMGVWLGWLD